MGSAEKLLGLLLHFDDLFGTGQGGKCDVVVGAICKEYNCKVEWIGDIGDYNGVVEGSIKCTPCSLS